MYNLLGKLFLKGHKLIFVNWINQPIKTGALISDRGYGSRVFNNDSPVTGENDKI